MEAKYSWSHLVWGVWIEMYAESPITVNAEKGHTSYEVCGLKYFDVISDQRALASHLVWGVWIEIGPRLASFRSI